ncbi:MAG: NAD-dependent epimerase/dehydratase family protein [Firmicutes bacterium]|nr:NAD-dependent epimerase/dehydratase family protein [Bacillota bacterium]
MAETILVTGGAGFIGSHTVDRLLARGYRVRVLDNLQPRVHPRGWPAWLPADVERVAGDVRDATAWERALDGVRGVFHLAAYQDYQPDFSTFVHVNAVSTALLFEVIAARKVPVEKVVLASSQAVYGEGKYRCAEHGVFYPAARPLARLRTGLWEHPCPQCGADLEPVPMDESVVHPHTAYGISKYAAELLGFQLGRRLGIPVVAMRYSIVQGPRNSLWNAYSGICRIFVQRLLRGQPPVVFEDGRQLRDYVHVADVARANLLVWEHPEAAFQAFNVGGQRATSVLEFAALAAQACEAAIAPVLRGDFRLGDTRHTISDSAKLRALGWAPQYGAEEILRDYVAWVREQGELPGTAEEAANEMRRTGVLVTATPSAREVPLGS